MFEFEDGVSTIEALLNHTAEKYAAKCAICYVDGDREVRRSYRRLYDDSAAFARFVSTLAPAGAHAAIIGRTSYEYLTCLNGIMMCGVTAVPLSEKSSRDEIVELLNDSDSQVFFYDSRFIDDVDEIVSRCEKITRVFDIADKKKTADVYKRFSEEGRVSGETADGVAIIIYTSGTTGARKGAMLTSGAVISNVYYKEMNFEGDHVALNVLPMNHIFSFSCDYLKNLKDGVKICLNEDHAFLGADLLRFEPTVVRLVPMIVDTLLRRVRILRRRDPSLTPREAAEKVFGRRLRNIIVSGAAYSAGNEREFDEMGITIRQGYGMTETGPRIAVPDGKTCAASGGRIISICSVRLVDGEIQVKSPSLMKGYYKRPEETAKVFTEDGWFKTGDLGRVTDDNELFIIGRKKNTIILSNGENVSPEEIELKYVTEPLVSEIEVFEDDGEIAAEIYPDYFYAQNEGIVDVEGEIKRLVAEKNLHDIAEREITKVSVRQTPLDKTQTGKIKRRNYVHG